MKRRLHAVLPGGNIVAAGKLIQACTCLPRRYSLASRYRLAPARQGISPRRAGTSLYLFVEELSLAKQPLGRLVQACTSLASRDKPLASGNNVTPR
ncbi:hypothetical protein PCANC_23452 [Puccinia coronata f. sp. avenae]|uniref:Uncharacterized protein n=1 Tax=Puccinia coronata f. sp. avenae TaxID=200324 RepID=A0A2N5UL86_9BASI|nr:hypothetical protein PCANC_23452 [Puccinia coronata f. sp. avenae]